MYRHNHGYQTECRQIKIARALYEHWVKEDSINQYVPWADLAEKQPWIERAAAVEWVL